jgi:hypothetical protein
MERVVVLHGGRGVEGGEGILQSSRRIAKVFAGREDLGREVKGGGKGRIEEKYTEK